MEEEEDFRPTLADIAEEELLDMENNLLSLEEKKIQKLEEWLNNYELPLLSRLRLFLNYYPQRDPLEMSSFRESCPKNWELVCVDGPKNDKVYRIYEEFEEVYQAIVQGDDEDTISKKDLELMEEWMNARTLEWEAYW